MKRLGFLVIVLLLTIMLSGCWTGEITVDTTFNADGSGSRSYILYVYDEDLSSNPIKNPDDPEGTEGKGAVINNPHVNGGVVAIQKWLEDNAPKFMTVEPMKTEGVQRIFTLTFKFKNFDDFLDKYEQLVNLSSTLKWSDFANDLPTFESKGFIKKKVEFHETRELVEASMDWAIEGIFNDIWQEASLAGFGLTKASIAKFASYKLTVGDETYEELQHFDPNAPDGEGTGKVVYVSSTEFSAAGTGINKTEVSLLVGGIVILVAAVGVAVFFILKKKKA